MSVANSEQSSVLRASALHHRSDALSSTVALAAIGASWLGFAMADPLGGLAVAAMILSQGFSVGLGSVRELLDHADDPLLGVDVQNFVASQGLGGDTAINSILDVPGPAKARRGALDLVVSVKPETTVLECGELEAELARRVKREFPVVTELRLRFRTIKPHQ